MIHINNNNNNNNGRADTGHVILYILLILPFLSISGLKNAMSIGAYQQWQMTSAAFMVIIIGINAKRIQFDSFELCLAQYELLTIIVLTYKHGFSPGIAVVSVAFVFLTALVKADPKAVLKALMIISIAVIIINMISLIMNFSAENEEYFVGGKNQLSMTIIPLAAFFIMYKISEHTKLRLLDVLLLMCAAAQVFLGKSGTGVVCIIIAVFMFVSKKALKSKMLLICIIIALNILFLFSFEYLSKTDIWLGISDWLDKSSTLTGRTEIWDSTKELIRSHWLIGNGRGTEIPYINSMGEVHNMLEAHNMFLQVLMYNGVIGLALFGRYLLRGINKLNINNMQQKIIFIAIFVCLINGLTEANNDNMLFRLLVAFAYYSEEV